MGQAESVQAVRRFAHAESWPNKQHYLLIFSASLPCASSWSLFDVLLTN